MNGSNQNDPSSGLRRQLDWITTVIPFICICAYSLSRRRTPRDGSWRPSVSSWETSWEATT